MTSSHLMRRLGIVVGAAVLAAWLAPCEAARADGPTLPQIDPDADPIGDTGMEAILEAEARERRERALRGPAPPDLPVREGAALTAPSGVRESAHAVDVTLDDGLAVATETLRFTSTARASVEIRYRVPVPAGAWLAGLEVCEASRCRRGEVRGDGSAMYDDAIRARPMRDSDAPPPVGEAERIRDARGEAIVVHAAPLRPGVELTVRVQWVAPAALHGGIARVVLPPRGQDPRAAAAELTVHAPHMLAATADGLTTADAPVSVEPWFPAELAATLASGAPLTASAVRVRCGEQTCTRARVAAGTRAGAPVDLVLLIDASPSTLGPARGRLEPAIAALLGAAPPGSRVRAVAFGSRAETVIGEAVETSRAPLVPLAQAAQSELGSATRIETAWQIVEPWLTAARDGSPAPLLVLVGDGGLSEGAGSDAALAAILANDVPFTVVDVGERAPVTRLVDTAERSGGAVVYAPPQAQDAAHLDERISAVFAPIVAPAVIVRVGRNIVRLPALRAGEERVWVGAHAGNDARISAGAASASASVATAPLATGLLLGLRTGDATNALSAVARAPDARRREHAGARGTVNAAAACVPYGPARHPSGVSSDSAPIALVEPRNCRSAAANEEDEREPGELPTTRPHNPRDGRGVPAETLLSMLRGRVVPAARACFRADRAGRANYSVRASLSFELADREILSTTIGGELAPTLRACLFEAVERLEVPRFEGTVVVRYPVYTEGTPPPPTIELSAGAARGVDRTFGDGVRVEDIRRLPRD